MPRVAIAGIVLLITAGCATPYQQHGFRGGYSDARIGQNTVLVSFKGNGHTSKERVQLYLLYRCAEVTRQYGYDYFVITRGDTEARTSYLSNYSATTTASAFGTGNAAFASAQTYGSGATIPVHKYGTDAFIKMFKGPKPSNDLNAYDARETLQYLGPQLGLSGNEPTSEKINSEKLDWICSKRMGSSSVTVFRDRPIDVAVAENLLPSNKASDGASNQAGNNPTRSHLEHVPEKVGVKPEILRVSRFERMRRLQV